MLIASESRCRFETRIALRRRVTATCVTLALLAGTATLRAADISVMLVDRDGRGIGEAVVTLTPATAAIGPTAALKPAVMDQRNLAFLPRVLVVEVGTSVEFPNNDSVSHQVYSFSPAKRFQLPLYKGVAHPPVTFDRPGLVVLGCNIHDAMVGYIYVTDAPYFGRTESNGGLDLKGLRGGDYRLAIWSPFISDTPESLVRALHVDEKEPLAVRIQVTQALRAQPEPKPRRRDWEY
jgi:plastocyanin